MARQWSAIAEPERRTLKIFPFDPMTGRGTGGRATIDIPNEKLDPGPVGTRIAVVDYDGAHRRYYPCVNLDDKALLMQGGLDPDESDPRFHQQMAYAVTMRVLENFESALGRSISLRRRVGGQSRPLRIFPHAFHGANAFYDRKLHALLFGYFRADAADPGRNLPGQNVFTCLSHDIVAHEMAHALVDRLKRYFLEPSNEDVLAFHEGFADLVALFQHFTFQDVLREHIQRQRTRLDAPALLVDLAQQFGYATGSGRALRSALGRPDKKLYASVTEPHERGSILVAAVFDGFFAVYQRRIRDLIRIATGGTGNLPDADLHPDLVNRVAREASATAEAVLRMCIRAFDYLAPVDIRYGDYLRALVTADYELNPADDLGLRAAMIEAFRQRGIYPDGVASLAEEALLWPVNPDNLPPLQIGQMPAVLASVVDAASAFSRGTSPEKARTKDQPEDDADVGSVSPNGLDLVLTGDALATGTGVPLTVNVNSPLVVYGDTSQDGVWYGGNPDESSSLGKFSNKPQPHMDGASVTLTRAAPVTINGVSVTLGTLVTKDDILGTITRAGGSWITNGIIVDGLITIDGKAVGSVQTFDANTLTLNNLTPAFFDVTNGSHNFSEFNIGTVQLNSGTWDSGFVVEGLLTIGAKYSISWAQDAGGDTITRSSGNWLDDGFAVGQTIAVAGSAFNNGNYQITAVNGSVLTLSVGNTVIPDGPETVSVTGDLGTISKRTDTTLTLIDLMPAFLTLTDPPFSQPLTRNVVQRNRLGQNADFFVFPLANQYRYAGNDVINASALFATVPDGQLPAVGLTAYGGPGNDAITGSAAGDHLAGGSGDDMIQGQRGVDNIYGDSGFNVDVITRALTVAQAAGNSKMPNLDPLTAGKDLLYGEAPGVTTTDATGDYDDVIFGDLGDITQDVAGPRDTTKPLPALPQRLQTTLRARKIDSQSRQTGADDFVYGNGGEDVLVGGTGNDAMDGSTERDLMFGDNVLRDRTTHLNDFTNLRFETLTGTQIYSTAPATSGQDQVNNVPRLDPRGHATWGDYLVATIYDHSFTPAALSSGDDYMAGGPVDDMLFGEMGNDTAQGDGSIDYVAHLIDQTTGLLSPAVPPAPGRVRAFRTPGGPADPTGPLTVYPSLDLAADGHDYIEGGGNNDLLLGNQGQDDVIGGSSNLFSLVTRDLRPDGADLVFGGSGTAIVRNNYGDQTANGHANDSDVVLGDNGDIFRIVGINGTPTSPLAYQTFNYDNYGTTKIVVRATRLLDYTPGGPNFNPAAAASDIGGNDEVHGESGDDFVYLQKGSDIAFGEGQDDDLVGNYGNDWISGGTGDDGILGDDGRIFTSRNSTTVPEPLYGIGTFVAIDPDPKTIQGNVINEAIYTPGHMQEATINVAGQLKKTVDLSPFRADPAWQPLNDETAYKFSNDDILFGGLGSDTGHGGSGDDAMGVAEALTESYTQTEDPVTLDLTGIARTDYGRPYNPGDALRFNPIDPNSHHPKIAGRTGEFALYDEFEPMRKVRLNPDGTLNKTNTGKEFFLNFVSNEGPLDTKWDLGPATPKNTDGDDILFGDNANDWIVGGTGRDNMWGGWGNDLINEDDLLSTAGELNNVPDGDYRIGQGSYEDRGYGGAGKDVLIANTGGDRLIDWVGEYNSYLVPFSPFGMATVSRTRQPFLDEYLYALSKSDGADPTRLADGQALGFTGSTAAQNGEPFGEVGLVDQHDDAWHGQTGPPTDPQAGNTPGTQRDVLRSANFSTGNQTGMFVETGTWAGGGGSYANAAASGDNVSLFAFDDWLPTYYEVSSSMKVLWGGAQQNAFIIFDYQSPTDFKYAGLDAIANKMRIGHRTAAGWFDDATTTPHPSVNTSQKNSVMFTANGPTATLKLGTDSVQFTFADPLNDGDLGVGTNNSLASFSTYTVQKLPKIFTYQVTEDFSDGVANKFTPLVGTWTTTSGSSGRYSAAPSGGAAISTRPLAVEPLSYVEYQATVRANAAGVSAGLVFAATDANNFLYAAVVAGTNQVVLGHRSGGVWFTDAVASATIAAGTDYTLLVALDKLNVNVVLNGKSVANFTYTFLAHAGDLGLFTRNGSGSFDNVVIRGDDQTYAGGGSPQLAAAAPPATVNPPAALTGEQLRPIVDAAIARWAAMPGVNADANRLRQVTVAIDDLPGLMMGQTIRDSIVIDPTAAGWGWFIDPTPMADSEFGTRVSARTQAATDPAAAGRMDLLTVMMHEFGHVLGLDAAAARGGVMRTDLAAGVRRTELSAGWNTGTVGRPILAARMASPMARWFLSSGAGLSALTVPETPRPGNGLTRLLVSPVVMKKAPARLLGANGSTVVAADHQPALNGQAGERRPGSPEVGPDADDLTR